MISYSGLLFCQFLYFLPIHFFLSSSFSFGGAGIIIQNKLSCRWGPYHISGECCSLSICWTVNAVNHGLKRMYRRQICMTRRLILFISWFSRCHYSIWCRWRDLQWTPRWHEELPEIDETISNTSAFLVKANAESVRLLPVSVNHKLWVLLRKYILSVSRWLFSSSGSFSARNSSVCSAFGSLFCVICSSCCCTVSLFEGIHHF